jgi:hypothetical protein
MQPDRASHKSRYPLVRKLDKKSPELNAAKGSDLVRMTSKITDRRPKNRKFILLCAATLSCDGFPLPFPTV